MIVAGVVAVLGAVVIVGVVEAAARGRLGVNQLAGIRIPSVMASDAAWVAGHRAARPLTWIGGLVFAVAGAIAATAPASGLAADAVGAVFGVGVAIALVCVVSAAFAARSAALRVGGRTR